MRHIYRASDDKFVKPSNTGYHLPNQLATVKFCIIDDTLCKYDPNDVPLIFKTSPDTLLSLASDVVNRIPVTPIYKWTNIDVRRWLRSYGYRIYQETFAVNLINGYKLLLLDASALAAMNIKNFEHIKHIAAGIRGLFLFELTRFGRSISLAPEFHYELYKLFRCKTGNRFETTLRTELWRQMQLLREHRPYLTHWEILERWMAREPFNKYPELFGGVRRFNLYQCDHRPPPPKPPTEEEAGLICICSGICQCYWNKQHIRSTRLSHLHHRTASRALHSCCTTCVPPCICDWKRHHFSQIRTMSVLKEAFPKKYTFYRTELGINVVA